ncbi:hypothetical protein DL95DRAFT_465878 [Leptodontidium sp. 2 PMI_412]|nr:hypothetical protein DL95DRAFT_465878 [Leptodontidium sp. 2 PMI_412]
MRSLGFWAVALTFVLKIYHCETSRPTRCPSSSLSNGQSDTWTTYHDVSRLSSCNETMLLDFGLYNSLDNPATHVTIRATIGKSLEKDSALPMPTSDTQEATQQGANTQLAWWGETDVEHQSHVVAATRKVQDFLQDGANRNIRFIFSYANGSVVGVFAGKSVGLETGFARSISCFAIVNSTQL